MDTDRDIWSNGLQRSGEIKLLLNFSNPILRNIKSNTEFESWEVSKNWVELGLIGADKSRPKLLATLRRVSVCDKW